MHQTDYMNPDKSDCKTTFAALKMLFYCPICLGSVCMHISYICIGSLGGVVVRASDL